MQERSPRRSFPHWRSKLIQQPHNCPQLFRLHLIRELAGEDTVFEVLDLFCVGVALGQVDGAGIAGGLLSRGIDAAVVFIDFAFALFVGNESVLELEAVGSAEGVSGCVPGSFGGNEEAGEFVYSGQIVLIRLLCAMLQEASGLPKAYTRKSRSWMCRS